MRLRLASTFGALLAALAFSACSSALGSTAAAGPGKDCDSCARAEVAPATDGAQEAAAAARGGQEASQAPFAKDTARIHPLTAVGRGSGPNSVSSADSEERHVVSGGAQNCGINIPTTAEASNAGAGGGGTSLATQAARQTVDILNLKLQQAAPADIAPLLSALAEAQRALAASSVNDRPNVTITYHQDHQRNVLTPFSSSDADGTAGGSASGSANRDAGARTAAAAAASKAMEPSPDDAVPTPPPPPTPVTPPGMDR